MLTPVQFDYAVLATADHVLLTTGNFGLTAAVIGRSGHIFLPEFRPKPRRAFELAGVGPRMQTQQELLQGGIRQSKLYHFV